MQETTATPAPATGPATGPATEATPPTGAWRNIVVLVLAQAFLGAQMAMIFTVGGLAGQMLAPDRCWATLPLALIALTSFLSAQPLSGFMGRYGRRAGFVLGNLAGGLGAAVSLIGLQQGSFALFSAGSALAGIYLCSQGFYRFAVTDAAPEALRDKAISYTLAGGLAATVIGLQLVRITAEATAVPFVLTYVAIIGLNLCGPVLFAFLRIPPPPAAATRGGYGGRTRLQLLRDPVIAVAIICGMVSYSLMNLVMTATPLAVMGCGMELSDSNNIISAHLLAMYLPSFLTGHLIARFGRETIVGAGLVILAVSGAVALSGVDLAQFYIALVLIGLGWNFGFIGATAMLVSAPSAEERGRVQGLNDTIVFGGVFLASLGSGGLMNCADAGNTEAGWQAVNLAMLPFLTLAGAALIWLVMRPRDTR